MSEFVETILIDTNPALVYNNLCTSKQGMSREVPDW